MRDKETGRRIYKPTGRPVGLTKVKPTGRSKSIRNQVLAWLKGFIAVGHPELAVKVYAVGKKLGYSKRTIIRAKEELNFHSTAKGGAWYFSAEEDPLLPDVPPFFDPEVDEEQQSQLSQSKIEEMAYVRFTTQAVGSGDPGDFNEDMLTTVMSELIGTVRESQNGNRFSVSQLQDFAFKGLDDALADGTLSPNQRKRLSLLLPYKSSIKVPEAQPTALDPAVMERVNALSTVEEVDAWLADLADLVPPPKIVEVLKIKRAQLKNEVF